MSAETRAIAERIASNLQGTCRSLLVELEEIEREDLELNQEFCNVLDSLVFECTGCSWWCEISEMTNDPEHDWHCTDCAPDLD